MVMEESACVAMILEVLLGPESRTAQRTYCPKEVSRHVVSLHLLPT